MAEAILLKFATPTYQATLLYTCDVVYDTHRISWLYNTLQCALINGMHLQAFVQPKLLLSSATDAFQ